MSREIKFRVWDKVEKRYTRGGNFTFSTENFSRSSKVFQPQPSWAGRYVIEQYTGRNDINGKEICEGDVCRLTYYTKSKKDMKWNKYQDGVEDINVVEFEDGYFKFSNTDEYGIGSELSFSDCYEFSTADGYYKYEVEIIGNIHKEIKKC